MSGEKTYQELELRKELLKAWNLLHEEFCGGNWPDELDYYGNPKKCDFKPPEILGSVDEIVAGLKALEEEFDADFAVAWESQQAQKGKTRFEPREAEYQELARLGKALKIPTFEAFLELEVRMPDGKVIHQHKQRSHSWVRNAYNLLLGQMAGNDLSDSTFGAGLLSIKDTGATIRYGALVAAISLSAASAEASGSAYRAAAGDDTHGIQVGSGTNAESFEDYVLQTLIADGTGAGQLSYILSEVPAESYASTTWTITHIRYLNNNTGGSVSVNEVALTAYGYIGANYKWMMSRDKLGSTVTVADTGQLKVTYTIQLTYPS